MTTFILKVKEPIILSKNVIEPIVVVKTNLKMKIFNHNKLQQGPKTHVMVALYRFDGFVYSKSWLDIRCFRLSVYEVRDFCNLLFVNLLHFILCAISGSMLHPYFYTWCWQIILLSSDFQTIVDNHLTTLLGLIQTYTCLNLSLCYSIKILYK